MSSPILVTGSAGFIGFHTALRLLERGEAVIGVDNLNAYYDPALKRARLDILTAHRAYHHHTMDLADRAGMAALFTRSRPDRIVHLGAQAGVRHSLQAPETYVDSNITGFLSVLEGARATGCRHLVFASTSSAYGANGKLPFDVHHSAHHPLTLYAATKLANEAMAHSYAHLFGIPMTGLRFFTVYGPWGRPDMALFKFTRAILDGQPIEVYGSGAMSRDFTYVDDIVTGIVTALDRPATVDPLWSAANPDPARSGVAPWRILNLGAGRPVSLMHYIEVLEQKLGRRARLDFQPMQDGDVVDTAADLGESVLALDYAPTTPVEEGVSLFVDWFCNFYRRN